MHFFSLGPTLVGMDNISLGPLEREVMKYIWQKKSCTAGDIVKSLSENREIAYNTIQTIMTRLVDKGLLTRKLQGKTHIYKAIVKKESTILSLVNQSMNNFIGQFGEEALVAFVDGLDHISDETRQKLIKKLQEK